MFCGWDYCGTLIQRQETYREISLFLHLTHAALCCCKKEKDLTLILVWKQWIWCYKNVKLCYIMLKLLGSFYFQHNYLSGLIFLQLLCNGKYISVPNPVLGKAQYVLSYLSPFFFFYTQALMKRCKKCHSFVWSVMIFNHDLRGKLKISAKNKPPDVVMAPDVVSRAYWTDQTCDSLSFYFFLFSFSLSVLRLLTLLFYFVSVSQLSDTPLITSGIASTYVSLCQRPFDCSTL